MDCKKINRIFILLQDIDEMNYEVMYLTDEIRDIFKRVRSN